MRDLTQHLTARADDNHAAPSYMFRRNHPFRDVAHRIRAQVRFFAYHRIKPHTPPLVRTPVNSFEFHRCRRTPQVGYLTLSLRHAVRRPHTEYPSFTAWTTRVSNPVRSPRFRVLASVIVQKAAFAIGLPRGIYAFHRYTTNSTFLYNTQVLQYPWHFYS